MISVIIPALNEEKALPATLARVLEQAGDYEVIVADGESTDGTVRVATAVTGVKVISARRGRASQMNAGARLARGHWLVFLHADTLLPHNALVLIEALPAAVEAGCFRQRFSGDRRSLRAVSWLHNFRCRRTGVMYGDQAMFVRKAVFDAIGGFPPVDTLEDIVLSETLLRRTRPTVIPMEVVTDARKFVQRGPFRSLMQCIAILLCRELRLPIPARSFFDPVR